MTYKVYDNKKKPSEKIGIYRDSRINTVANLLSEDEGKTLSYTPAGKNNYHITSADGSVNFTAYGTKG